MYDRGYWTQVLVGWVVRTLFLTLFLLTLRGLLRAISPKNRAMQPNVVWLNLIPYFDYVWIFVTLVKVRASLRAEYEDRGWPPKGESSFGVGLTSAIFYVFAFAVAWLVPLAPDALLVVFPLSSLASLILWIIYWVKISRLRTELLLAGATLGNAPAPPYAGAGGYGAYQSQGGQGRRRCSSCGMASEPGDDFCRSCGSRLDAAVSAQDTEPDPAEQAPGESGESDSSDAANASVVYGASCPFCGADYRPRARFCSVCGRPAV